MEANSSGLKGLFVSCATEQMTSFCFTNTHSDQDLQGASALTGCAVFCVQGAKKKKKAAAVKLKPLLKSLNWI